MVAPSSRCRALDLDAHFGAELGVEVEQGLVEQEDAGAADQGTADGDALALAAGELAGLAVEELAGSQQGAGHPADTLLDLGAACR